MPLRASAIDRQTRAWILSRAAAADSEGKPAWSYPQISRMLRNTRRIALSADAVRRFVQQHGPDIFARRHAARFGQAA